MTRPSRYGAAMRSLEVCGSTNDEARQWANTGAPDGAIVTSLQQTKGRGRLGREWVSSGENLYFSAVSRPNLSAEQLPLLSLVVGLSVAEGVEPLLTRRPLVKWPNDVFVEGRKLSGILLELSVVKERCEFVIIGVGINVNQREFPPEIASIATSMSIEEGKGFSLSDVLWSVLSRQEENVDALGRGESANLLARWRNRSYTLGRQVRVSQASGEMVGLAVDINPEGALILRGEDGAERLILAGDVGVL
jgi:BirA family biotin operon repressor/biotin-[acetyl-CoA-carboxylase] ligase